MSVDIVTFGCRLNITESEIIRHQAAAVGLNDAVIVNTCAVTAEAVRQARQTIRRIKREKPETPIVVTGCAAQTQSQQFAEMAEVDRVLGNEEKLSAVEWTKTRIALQRPSTDKFSVSDIMMATAQAPHPIDSLEGHTRAFVQVQNGCDHRCTFCIIPFGRGNSRSLPIEDVVSQVRRMSENGYREIVLTGVDLTGYGTHLPDAPQLGVLVKRILKEVPELERLRLSSIDAVEVDADLLDAIANESRLMPHLHLSLQAGDDLILKRMKRRHSRAQAIDFCDRIRRLRPDVAFGADIIVGFPTETEVMFEHSLDLVDACALASLHVFPFSPRPATPAARMPQVDRAVVKERARRLREKGAAALRRYLTAQVGKQQRVLTERGGVGRTEQFAPVRLASPMRAGLIVNLTIADHNGVQLLAA